MLTPWRGALFTALALAAPAPAADRPVKASLDLRHPGPAISPLIFGVSWAKEEHRTIARIALERFGGNRASRFDWKTGNDAAGNDWFFVNGGANAASPDAVWYHQTLQHNAELGITTLMTVPTIGWVAKDNHSSSFSVAKYGAQKRADTAHPDWGNGEKPDGTPIVNDPNDAGKPITAAYVGEWIAYLKAKYGPADGRIRRAYALDNEPGIWHSTHRDIHPGKLSYDEAWQRTMDYANAIKDADPAAQVWGPVEWGWLGIKYSAADATDKGYAPAPDSKAHHADYFLHWYIQQLAAYKKKTGRLLVDVIDIHDYPEVYIKDAGRIVNSEKDWKPAAAALARKVRLDTVRTWWEPGYAANGEGYSTWIDEPMFLLRRVQGWIKAELPELKLAVTEYNFGGNDSINGTLVHALIWQALMQEGAYAAAEWGPPTPTETAFQAYRLFRNYDAQGGSVAGVYVPGKAASPDLTVYGALDQAAGALRVVIVNRNLDKDLPVSLDAGRKVKGGPVKSYAISALNPGAILEMPVYGIKGSTVAYTAPAYSVSLLVLPIR